MSKGRAGTAAVRADYYLGRGGVVTFMYGENVGYSR